MYAWHNPLNVDVGNGALFNSDLVLLKVLNCTSVTYETE